jgi:UDP-N-acetylmuramoyl-tripeptide--D-alanyl-D-alanine ligase
VDLVKFYNLLIEADFAFTTDSRKVDKGSIFFALKGDNFNGNQYALQALQEGARYAVVDEPVGDDDRLILVKDVLTFFQQVARFHRKTFAIPVIGIAGSNGKTTTKNLVFNVLSKKYKTHCTQGNFNNHIGVPITLLQTPTDCEILIVELGTNNPGEIEELCKIAEPNFGVITNIGKEHLEGFGSLEAVAKEESELYLWLQQNKGIAFVNEDDEHLSRMGKRLQQKVTYTKKDLGDYMAVPQLVFKYNNTTVSSSLMGDYNLDNINTAITIGSYFEVEDKHIVEAIEAYKPDNNRSEIIQRGTNTIWLDAYNANPSSMQKAIENFSQMPQKNKVLILGDMFEMGDASEEEHNALLQLCTSFNFSAILLLGENFAAVSENSGIKTFRSMEELGEAVKEPNYQETAFLIKGSRGMKMERVLDYL